MTDSSHPMPCFTELLLWNLRNYVSGSIVSFYLQRQVKQFVSLRALQAILNCCACPFPSIRSLPSLHSSGKFWWLKALHDKCLHIMEVEWPYFSSLDTFCHGNDSFLSISQVLVAPILWWIWFFFLDAGINLIVDQTPLCPLTASYIRKT